MLDLALDTTGELRRCPKCSVVKSPEAFAVDRSKPSGRKSWCRNCDNDRVKARINARNAEKRGERKTVARRPARPKRRKSVTHAQKTTARGYGRSHQVIRARVALGVDAGRAICARCGLPIAPGEPWHLDHDDADRSRYIGPSHAGCNLAAGGRLAYRPESAPRRTSRPW